MCNSFKKTVDRKIKKENKYLFSSKGKFWSFQNNYKNSWCLIVPIVGLLFFIVPLINIPFLNFIQIDDVKTLIENRTRDIVTLISVIFAIISFLIANLAIKEPYTYNLLFKKSGFFPVAFYALTVIGCFIIFSTLKDHISIENRGDIFLAGVYMILGALIFIGLLFTQLARFPDKKYILELIRKEVIKESKENLLIIARRIFSYNVINELGFANYTMAYFTPKTKGEFQMKENQNYVKSIKIKQISKIIKTENTKSIFVNNLFLYRDVTQKDDGFFYVEQNGNTQLAEKLNNCVKTTAKTLNTNSETKKYVIQEINENIKTNNHKLVKEYLDILSEMYELQQNLKF